MTFVERLVGDDEDSVLRLVSLVDFNDKVAEDDDLGPCFPTRLYFAMRRLTLLLFPKVK